MQKSYTESFIKQLPGMLIGNGAPPKVRSLRNLRPGNKQTATFAVTAAGTGVAQYQIQFDVGSYPAADTLVIVDFDAAHDEEALATAIVLGINTNDTIYQEAGIAELDPDVVNGIKFTGHHKGVDILNSAPTVNSTGAAGTISAPAIVGTVATEQVPYGLFVGQLPGYGEDDATLPVAGDDTMTIQGVTMITSFNELDAIGGEAIAAYRPGDWMDIINKTLQLKGIVVRCVETNITKNTPIFVSTDANTLGQATTVAAGNIALPNATVEKGSYVPDEMPGVYSIQVSLT